MPRATRARAAKGALREKTDGETNVVSPAPDAKAVGAVKAVAAAATDAAEAVDEEWSMEREFREIDEELDKRCGEIMKNAKDFAVMIRKQLKKEIVKIPKKIRSMSLKEFFEKHGDDLGEEMLTDVKVRLGLLPPDAARTLAPPPVSPPPAKPVGDGETNPSSMPPPPAKAAPPPPANSAPKPPASMPPPPPVFNTEEAAGDAAAAATPAGKRAKTGGLSDDVGGSFAVPSTPKGAGVAGITRTDAGAKIAVAQTPGTKRRVKRGEMLYSANGSPLGAVDGGASDDESPVVGAAPPPSSVKKITMSVRKRAREEDAARGDGGTGGTGGGGEGVGGEENFAGLVIQMDDGAEIDLGALDADPDKEGAEKALGVLQNLQANVAAMMAKLQGKQQQA